MDYQYADLPDGLSLDSVIRIGYVETTVRTFIKNGMVKEENGKLIRTDERYITSAQPNAKPDPFSLIQLQMRGFKVQAGKRPEDDQVMIVTGSYYRITDALKSGLLTETTQPPIDLKVLNNEQLRKLST